MERFPIRSIAVGYMPRKDEPNPATLPLKCVTILPNDARSDPFEFARRLSAEFANADVCMCVPGTAFDDRGTRHGRGGGWYDRLLSSVPSRWARIGVCFEKSFSRDPLMRETWDQPMDWVCVQKVSGMDYYETKARIL